MYAFQYSFPQPAPATMMGKTRYHYVTPDGGPPMEGKVPTGSALDPPNPFSQPPNPFAQGSPNFWGAPTTNSWYPCAPINQPPPYYAPNPPAAVSPWDIPLPPPIPSRGEFYSSGKVMPPLQGNRVKGQLPKFDNGLGYIFPKNNCTLNIFHTNVISKFAPSPGTNEIDPKGEEFSTHTAPCDMTFAELIERIECRSRANHHPPYNQPGQGYPDHYIGIQELLRRDDGTFVIGTQITLSSVQAKAKIGDIWPDSVGSAGQEKPRYIVRLPV